MTSETHPLAEVESIDIVPMYVLRAIVTDSDLHIVGGGDRRMAVPEPGDDEESVATVDPYAFLNDDGSIKEHVGGDVDADVQVV